MDKKPNPFAHALILASSGFSVFPVHSIIDGHCTCGKLKCEAPGKHPRTSRGFHDGTTDAYQIKKWWQEHPNSNVGLVTGKVSGLIVLDIDPRNGGDDSFSELIETYGEFPETKMVLTGGGGQHLYFSYPLGVTVGCRANLFPGIDLKGDGGYVIAPPSLHISGKRYEWEVSSWDFELASPPIWLLNFINRPQNREPSVREILAGEKTIQEGSRNNTLAKLAGFLLGKGLKVEATFLLCKAFNLTSCCPPLPQEEVLTIVKSISKLDLRKRQGGQHG